MVQGLVSARRFLVGSVATVLAFGVLSTAAPKAARATGGELGGHGGPVLRTSGDIGKTFGAFVGIRFTDAFPLYFDVFYTQQQFELSKRTPQNTHRVPDIDIVGGRFRYLIPVTKRLAPYGHLGLGYAHISYPGLITPNNTNLANGASNSIIQRSGGFAELPLGLGLAIEVAKQLRVNIEGTFRPGFAFGGAAYHDRQLASDATLPAEKKVTMGGSLTGGVSFYF